jgi:hypothetical protein
LNLTGVAVVAAAMTDILPWLATAATVLAATMTAANLGSRITGYGFAVFTVGSLSWIGVGLTSDQPALVWTNVVLTFLNLFGVWRWLGRQAKVEEGGRAAAEASDRTPGESLFPASLLTKAVVEGREGALGSCVDAMVGGSSGRVAYIAVSQGGVAGVGETLRRLPWARVQLDGDVVRADLSGAEFDRLEQIERDSWPAR